ncbi:wd40 repeat protein [Anaeramoeba flamelloides]|uniref:Wd40 repeat protein n=1 Tax=Anaeramoeba flamelloides TaxID=1746091 RepID=A0ABQ8XGY3_9EUKA|nr:wd40 repeat protein [Anaeramoeba flamelloides]
MDFYEDPNESNFQTRDPNKTQFDGRQIRESFMRKTINYHSSVVLYLQKRIIRQTNSLDNQEVLKNEKNGRYLSYSLPTFYQNHNYTRHLPTYFVHSSLNKDRCPINVISFTPSARRLITGSSRGELTLWDGFTFNFVTISQGHNSAIRAIKWTSDGKWFVTADQDGKIMYWEENIKNVKNIQGHEKPIRDLSFSPTDFKFCTGSDDSYVKIFDFANSKEERVLTGHGWIVINYFFFFFYNLFY